MSPHFTADGTRVVYSTGIGGDSPTLHTWVVPVLGGRPQLLLTNTEGLTFFNDDAGRTRILFSEMTGRGSQMSIVTALENRRELCNVYVPPDEFDMAHRSYLSPDCRRILRLRPSAVFRSAQVCGRAANLLLRCHGTRFMARSWLAQSCRPCPPTASAIV
jgi:hypothetical protein